MKLIIVNGTIMHNAEYRNSNDGSKFLTFDVSVSNGKDGLGNYKTSDFFKCMMNDKQAAKIHQYLTKGTKVTVQGSPTCKAYIAKDNTPKASISISVDKLYFTGSRNDSTVADVADNSPYILPDAPITASDLDSVPF